MGNSRIAPFHMAAEIDEQTNEMTFLYRFLPGLCPASHGHNVAKLAGLPQSVLDEALARSAAFERGEVAGGKHDSEGADASKCEPWADDARKLAAANDAEGLRNLFRKLK